MHDQNNSNDDEFPELAPRIERSALVSEDYCGRRLDQVAAELFEEFSRSRIQQWIRDGLLRVNDEVVTPKRKLLGGEQLQISAQLEQQGEWLPEKLPLNILHEDKHLIIIDKAANSVVHPGAGNHRGTLLNGLLGHCPQLVSVPRAGIVHRLDKDTTGLMVVAKTLEAHTDLVNQLQARSVARIYQAVVQGVVTGSGRVDQPMGRHPKQRIKMAVVANGKPARTNYQVIQRYAGHTHLRLKLETGRTHQIRVHMAHLGFPLVGDGLYGGRNQVARGASAQLTEAINNFDRQALHAVALGFVHPGSGQPVSYSSPLPADFAALVQALADDQ